MVGNTFPYTIHDWIEDITLAHKHAIDGFALNVGREDWQVGRVSDCFDAAELHGKGFKLFMSFDMSSIPSSIRSDISYLETYMRKFAHHPNYLLYDSKVLVSTFAGENALFGYDDLSTAWSEARKRLDHIHPVFFIPSFFIDPARYRTMRCIDGAFNWNGGWPVHLTPDSPPDDVRCPKLLSDLPFLAALKPQGKAYMAAVSPWFFTHYGAESWNKNWIYRADDWLLVRRWEQLIAPPLQDAVDIVQIISWNDFGESHYIGPVRTNAAQPGSHAWVDGCPHDAWLKLCAPFARAFKSTSADSTELNLDVRFAPRGLDDRYRYQESFAQEDRIFAWARPHPREAVARADLVGRPRNWELTEDVFWVVVFARAPAHVGLSTGGATAPPSDSSHREDKYSKWHWHAVPAGLSKLKCPLVVDGSMRARLMRGGETIMELDAARRGSNVPFVFEAEPETYNFNAYVATAPTDSEL